MSKYHPLSEKIVSYLDKKVNNNNKEFFRIIVAYYFSTIASQMRATIVGYDNTRIPINMYAINLSPSGTGKGVSTNFMEQTILKPFQEEFTNTILAESAEEHMKYLAGKRASDKGTSPVEELEALEHDYKLLGHYLPDFDSATVAAIKQQRNKILLSNCGSLNFIIDEIGSNLKKNVDVFATFLELYDVGRLKEKLIKNTLENRRLEHLEGITPANMLMFGTPYKLLDSSTVQELFVELLNTGFARRCLYGYNKETVSIEEDALSIVENMLTVSNIEEMEQISYDLASHASIENLHKEIKINKEELVRLFTYKLECEKVSKSLPEHESLKKIELDHRYFKALKLAGLYAFLDKDDEISIDHLEAAIFLVEESGKAFEGICTVEQPYIKLAKYLANSKEVTLADMVTELPYFKGSKQQKDEMLQLAVAWGSKNNIIIKKTFVDGILFLDGDSLEETDINKIQVATSDHPAYGYEGYTVAFKDLDVLGKNSEFHWTNHYFVDNHRNDENTIEGFNVLVFDVDDGFPISATQKVLKDYYYFIYTTKSHTPEFNKYRIVLPISHIVKLNKQDYKEFYANVLSVIPITIDPCSNQRSKKWLCNDGEIYFNEGELFNILPYIPRTKQNEERLNNYSEDLTALEAWFIEHTGEGNRNNQLYNYGRVLYDKGLSYSEVRNCVVGLNDKIRDKLTEDEIEKTILASIFK